MLLLVAMVALDQQDTIRGLSASVVARQSVRRSADFPGCRRPFQPSLRGFRSLRLARLPCAPERGSGAAVRAA
jgi:hypothetical protein